MKKLVFKFSLFILGVTLILISYFTQPSAEMNKSDNLTTNSIIDTQFQIGAIQDGHHSMYNYIKDSLHFNVWHQYTSLLRGWDDKDSDNYLAPAGDYASIVTERKSQNDSKGLRTYFDRPTVSYIISGQRTDYECEIVTSDNLFWFNSYKSDISNDNVYDTIDRSRYGIGEKVKCCRRLNSNPDAIAGFIDTGIKVNRNLSYGVAANPWCSDDAWDWYVMPRIRIDSVFAAQPGNINEPICRVIITGWQGDTVRNIMLRVKSFKYDESSVYTGEYKDKYIFTGSNDSLKIDTATIKHHFLSDKVYAWNDKSCKVDIKIYWTGKCDMWIDRVRLENEPAHKYLTLKDSILNSKVNAEIGWANNNGIPNYFYFEENTLSHFPLIQALNKQILEKSDPQNSNSLIIWYNDYQVNAQIPDYGHFTPAQVRALLIDSCKLKTIMLGWYGLEGWASSEQPNRISYHPSSLLPDDYNKYTGVLSYVTGSNNYENWLQDRVEKHQDITTIMEINKLMSDFSQNNGTQSGLNVIYCPQAHSFLMNGGPLKEPTNEEIELQTNIALMHNTKGIMFYAFNSFGNFSYPELNYSRGIMDTTNTWSYIPRTNTVYHQNKFAKIKELSSKLNKWGPYFMKFDPNQNKNCIYRNAAESQNFLSNSYFSAFNTSILNPNTQCAEILPNTLTEPQNKTYLHIATFDDNSSDKNFYFMVSNNRCTPGDDDCSGRRFVSVSL